MRSISWFASQTMMSPLKLLFHNKTYFVWKPNICFIRDQNNYNSAATENTADLTMAKRRESDCLNGENETIPWSIWVYHTMNLIPQPSLHLVVREKVNAAAMGMRNNCSVLHLLPGPQAVLCTALATVFHSRVQWGLNQVHSLHLFLTHNKFIRKPMSGRN